jgi:hypothetical protein
MRFGEIVLACSVGYGNLIWLSSVEVIYFMTIVVGRLPAGMD